MTQPPYDPQQPQQPIYGQPWQPAAPPPPTSSKAVTALVLGILGVSTCGFLTAIPAIFVGRSATQEIDASGGQVGGRGVATAGVVLGVIGTLLSVVAALVVAAVFIFGSFIADEVGDRCTTVENSDGSFTVECS